MKAKRMYEYEGIRDILKPKSDEDIDQALEGLSPAKLLKFAIDHKNGPRIIKAIKNGANIQPHQFNPIQRILPGEDIEKYMTVNQIFKVGIAIKDVKKMKREAVNDMKQQIKKVSPTKETWASFIDSIQC